MPRIVRVSVVQMPAVIEGSSFARKQKQNVDVIVRMLKVAGERRSDLVLFGEYANLHHRTWSEDVKEYVADPIPGSFTRTAARYAKKFKMNVVLPLLGTYRNALSSYVVLFDRRGDIVGCYQKGHPTEAEQSKGMKPGGDLPVFCLDCCTVGIMTCMDIEYPEVAQVLMLRGAELLLFPHVQAGWGEVDWEIRYRARAVDTGLPVVSACYGYPEGEWAPGKMIGRSGVVGRDGLILADCGRGIGVLTTDLDLDEKRVTQFFFHEKHDRTLAVTASRRPELYGELVNRESKARAARKIKGTTR